MPLRASKHGIRENLASFYEKDFFVWTQRTAELLRAGRFTEIDVEHAAEEIEGMGKRDLKEVNIRMQVLLMHLLKWLLQPDMRSSSWRSKIVAQRIEIEAVLRQSPSLRARLGPALPDNYVQAIRRALPETGLPKEQFPAECPFTLRKILDDDFLPE